MQNIFFKQIQFLKIFLTSFFSADRRLICLLFYFPRSCDSIDKLRSRLPSLEKEIQDPAKFKEFYQFTFNYAKNPGQKGLELDMALAYWNIVLKGKFRLLEIWTRFLKVNISYFLNG
jgi:hypothetical protein